MAQSAKYLRKEKSGRLLALDAARGLAVIGMYIQHFALSAWNGNIVSGNTMILFILCSGISFTLSYQANIRKSLSEADFRIRMLVRAVFIYAVGYLLILLNGPFGMVLPAFALLSLIGIPFKDWSIKRLAAATGLAFFICPVVMILGECLLSHASLLADFAGGPLSAVGMLPVFLLGMLLGRLDLHDTRKAFQFLVTGIALLLFVLLIDRTVLPIIRVSFENWLATLPAYQSYAEINEYAPWPQNVYPPLLHMLFYTAPQNGSFFTLLRGVGTSLVAFGLCIFAQSICAKVLSPFTTVGKCSLTMYAIQFVLGWLIMLFELPFLEISFFGWDILVALLVIAIAFLINLFGGGILEKGMRNFTAQFLS